MDEINNMISTVSQDIAEEVMQSMGVNVNNITNSRVFQDVNENTIVSYTQDNTFDAEIKEPVKEDYEETEAIIIPQNPKDIKYLVNGNTDRFRGAVWFNKFKLQNITVIGLGGIGSNLMYNLARLQPNMISVYDMDTVEESNLAGQHYTVNDLGKLKTTATTDMIKQYAMNARIYCNSEFDSMSYTNKITIVGPDNMKTRKLAFNKWVKTLENDYKNKQEYLFIDGRLAFNEFQIFAIQGDDYYHIDKYKESLFDDNEAEETICSMKQTTFCASMIGAIMTNLVVNFIANLVAPDSHIIPFKTFYNSDFMFLKTDD